MTWTSKQWGMWSYPDYHSKSLGMKKFMIICSKELNTGQIKS
ncbi:hypothetical protein BSUBE1_0603 [Bacillus subtilis E1]|nr:hypothetical protein BSUBE1_0603 [Bacillus subtilis E1]